MKKYELRESEVFSTICYFVLLIMSLTLYVHPTCVDVNPSQSEDKIYKRVDIMPSFPKWKPGLKDCKAVHVLYTLPVNFKIRWHHCWYRQNFQSYMIS